MYYVMYDRILVKRINNHEEKLEKGILKDIITRKIMTIDKKYVDQFINVTSKAAIASSHLVGKKDKLLLIKLLLIL